MSPLSNKPETSGVGRRGFLKAAAASSAVAACQRLPVHHAIPFLVQPEEITPGQSTSYASTCTACPAACGLLVTVRDGRPVKLEGHPEHPLSKGGLCAFGQADIRALYDSERPGQPSVGGQAVTWDVLDKTMAERLTQVTGDSKKVALISRTITSPTARRAIRAFLDAHDGTWIEYDSGAESSAAAVEAYRLLTGRALRPALRIDKADLLVVLGSDLLGAGWDPVTHTQQYAGRRGQGAERGPIRHVQIEGPLSLTGAAADERWAARASEQRLIALWLLRHVAARASGVEAEAIRAALAELPGLSALSTRTAALAQALMEQRGRGLVVSGANDLGEQLAVALVNRLVGAEGHTLDVEAPSLTRRGDEAAVADLRQALNDGEVGALIVLECDPVTELTDGESLAQQIQYLPLSVSVASAPTATASLCSVIAAADHGLERWADFMPRPGIVTLSQPTIRRLHDTRHPMESLLAWAGEDIESYHAYLKISWEETVFPDAVLDEFEAEWLRSVGRGGIPADHEVEIELPEAASVSFDRVAKRLTETAEAARIDVVSGPPEIEVHLLGEVAVRDASRMQVPWLRELPDPLTQTSWTPVVRLAPKLAERLHAKDGDVLQIVTGSATLEMQARIIPGTHPSVLAVPVGYPQQNGFQLSAWNEDGTRLVRAGLPARVQRIRLGRRLPAAQIHVKTEGRPIVHQVGAYDEQVAHGHHELHSLWAERPAHSPSWEMVIDLDKCTACSACLVACQVENNVAVVGADEIRAYREMHWIRMDRYFDGDEDNPDVLFEPMLCQQCDHAPCETVCPVLATMHSSDGLNQQVYNRCVGTRYCANNCPYKVRRFNWFENDFGGPLERMVLNPDVVVRERGVMEKCTFCVQRIQASRIEAKVKGLDVPPRVQTACQQTCPAGAITFGDGSDPESDVSKSKVDPRAFQVLAEVGVRPSITYKARVRNRSRGS